MLLLVGCAVTTAARLPAWRSDDALWADAHRHSPALPRPMLNLGAVALRQGDAATAEEWWTKAEQTGRLTDAEMRELKRMRCHAAILYGNPAVPLEHCSS